MSNGLVLYVDFDSTLYDTKRFANDLWHTIAAQAGLPVSKVKADAGRHTADQVLGGYDYAKHVAAYGLDLDEMWRQLDTIIHSTDYLYDDSVGFIRGLLADGYEPKILSFGEKHFQEAKIMPTLEYLAAQIPGKDRGSAKLVFDVICRKKGEHIAEAHRGQQGVLVDDIPDQQLPSGFSEIHLDRRLNLAKPTQKPGGFTVSNLAQARQVIQRLR